MPSLTEKEKKTMVNSRFPTLDIRKTPLHEVMLERIRLKPERTALVDGQTGKSWTYDALDGMVVRLASGLRRLGVTKGDIVIVFCPNCTEFIVAALGIVASGATAAFVNPSYTTYEFEHALKVTRPSWILTVPSLLNTAIEAVRNIKANIRGTIVVSDGTYANADPVAVSTGSTLVPFETLMADDGSWYPSEMDFDSAKDVAFILFSSGTTGLPKGVMLSHSNVVSMMTVFAHIFENDTLHAPDEQPVVAVLLPLYHVYGLIGITTIALASNQMLVVLPKFHPEQFLSCIAKYKVTVAPLVPPILVFLSKYPRISSYDLSSVRRFNCGAAPLTLDTAADFRKATGCGEIRQGYGMTETTVAVMYNAPGYPLKSGSVGLLLPNTTAQVIDLKSKKVLGPRERGEIWLRGPQIMLGYINDPTATQSTIDSDGWLHTGDVGYYDEDGYFFVVDRIKELIKFKGLQVAPAELESLILTHPQVADVAVIGIPDKEAGELPKAFVVRKKASTVSAEDVKKFVAGKVSSYKHLRGGVEFVDKIPKSETGKILRRVLRQGIPVASKL